MSAEVEKELPEQWSMATFGDIADLLRGVSYKKPDASKEPASGKVPVLRANNIGYGLNFDDLVYVPEKLVKEEQYIKKGDIIIAMSSGSKHLVGKAGQANEDYNGAYGAFCANLRVTEGIDPKYAAYFYSSQENLKRISASSKGSNINNLKREHILEAPIPIAPAEQQKRIVAKIEELFSHIDAGIEALKKAKQLLKQYRQSVLKAAVTGELTKEWREANKDKLEPASQLLERILKERRQKWEQQQLEQFKAKGKMPKGDKWKEKYKEAIEFDADIDIPEGWIGATTDQVFYYITSGSRGWAKYYSDEGPIFLRMGNLEHYDVKLDLEDIQRVNPPEGAEGSRTKVEPGDSLISITADVGMVGIVPDGFEEAYINQHVSLARPVIPGMGLYLAWLLSGDFAKEQFKALQRGATKVGLGLDDIRALQFGLPSLEEQEEIVRLIEEKLSSIEHLDAELDQQLLKAEKNKQSVLASAFKGELQ